MLTPEDLNKVETEIKALQKWMDDHKSYETFKVKRTEQSANYELFLMLIADMRTIQQQNKQLIEALEKFSDRENWTVTMYKGEFLMEWNVTQLGHPITFATNAIKGGASNG